MRENKMTSRDRALSRDIANRLYTGKKSGTDEMRPLRHKDGRKYSDYDYFMLLAAKCEELEANNPNPRMPINYHALGFDPDCVRIAKNVKEMRKEGYTEKECSAYISQCIVYN